MSNTLCHKSPVIEARFFCKPGRRSYPEKRRVLYCTAATSSLFGISGVKDKSHEPRLVHILLCNRKTNQGSCWKLQSALDSCSRLSGIDRGSTEESWGLMKWYSPLTILLRMTFDFLKWRRSLNDVCRTSLYSRYYDMGSKFIVTSCPGYVRTNCLV